MHWLPTALSRAGLRGADALTVRPGLSAEDVWELASRAAGAHAGVALMDAGADDYVRRPFDAPRFVARVAAAVRRSRQRQEQP